MRVFDLIVVVREPLTSVLSGGPLMLPGSVAPDDQEALLALLQTRCAPTPLRRVEVDLRGGFTEPARRLLTRLTADRGANGMLLVLRHGTTALLREVLADPLLRAVPRVVAVVAHPGGEEDLTAWSELGRAVRLALHASFRERASELGVPADALDAWHEYFETLTNPCALVRLANEIVEASYRTQGGEAAQRDLPRVPGLHAFDTSPSAHVSRGLVEHELAWRPWSELLVLIALATGFKRECAEILGVAEYTRTLNDLEAQGLWHPDEGLRDWVTRLEHDEFWRARIGRDRRLPTAQQRAEGWDDRCDDLCASIQYQWLDPFCPSERTPFVRAVSDLEQALVAGSSRAELRRFVDDLARRVQTEATSAKARSYYLQVVGEAAARRGDFTDAVATLRAALDELPPRLRRTRLYLQSRLGRVYVEARRYEEAIALLRSTLETEDFTGLPCHKLTQLVFLAAAHAYEREFPAALDLYREGLALTSELQFRLADRITLLRLCARMSVGCGGHEDASQYARAAIEAARKLGVAGAEAQIDAWEWEARAQFALSQRIAARDALVALVELASQGVARTTALDVLRVLLKEVPKQFSDLRDEFTPKLVRLEARAAAR